MNTRFPMLIRREFWEHRSLWIAPLVWIGLIVLFATWAMLHAPSDHHVQVLVNAHTVEEMGLNDHDRQEMQKAMQLPEDRKQSIFAFSFLAIFGLISVFSMVVVFFYLLDCLYTERKDRSILFWKSMPVSDTEVVISKLVVAMIVVPVGGVLLAAVTQFLLYIIAWLFLHGSVIGEVMPDWSFLAWLRSQGVAFGLMVGGALWYAPIAGYLLMLSAWTKNKVFLWAVVPPIALAVLEKVFLGSTQVSEFLGRRFGGYIDLMKLDSNAFESHLGTNELPRVSDVYNAFHLSNMFTSLEMWLGVVVAAAMIFATIRIRRFRDDS
jgi:ABC-2 type transport system permease protein